MKYCLRPLEILQALPSGFPSGSGNISLYTTLLVTIQLQTTKLAQIAQQAFEDFYIFHTFHRFYDIRIFTDSTDFTDITHFTHFTYYTTYIRVFTKKNEF